MSINFQILPCKLNDYRTDTQSPSLAAQGYPCFGTHYSYYNPKMLTRKGTPERQKAQIKMLPGRDLLWIKF